LSEWPDYLAQAAWLQQKSPTKRHPEGLSTWGA
jgi:hypothetical protein